MPQLFSRPDEAGWLTPSMADIMVQGTAPVMVEENIREQVAEIQRILNAEGVSVRVTDVRPSPSRTLIIVRAEASNRRGGKRPAPTEIRRSLSAIAEQHADWTLGFINAMPGDTESMGILLRTDKNQPLQLRQLLTSGPFTHHQSSTAIIMGVEAAQHILVSDLVEFGHIAIYGPETSRLHALRAIFTTLLLFNTPAELRIALVGKSGSYLEQFADSPHILGKVAETPEAGLRLFEGMVRETEHRWQAITEGNLDTFDQYNDALRQRGEPIQPRLIVLFDSPMLPNWFAEHERWAAPFYDLLINGPRVGIHPVIVLDKPDDALPALINDAITHQLVMRSVAGSLTDSLEHLHNSALRFLDALWLQNGTAKGLELCAVASEDMHRLTKYWQQAQTKRSTEQRMRDSSGLAGISAPEPSTSPAPSRPASFARAAQVLTGTDEERLLSQAQALAAYLGWLGLGPLRDVLGLSSGEARAVLATLQQRGVIEQSEGAIYRFLRLADNPYASH